MVSGPGPVRYAIRRFREDVSADPYLRYILLATLLLAGFWFWHRIPNFATWDEHVRVLDPLVAYATVLSDPSVEGVRRGVAWGRAPFGATFYLYALATLPVVVYAALTGQLAVVAAMRNPGWQYAHYEVWASTPRWVWTGSLVGVRLTNVVFAVVTVYLLYRLGTVLRDRATGRLAAVLLTVTFGFLKLAKEGGEDIPATMCLVAALYLLVTYIQRGSRRRFYAASAVGALAIAFKVSLAPVVLVVGLAHLLWARSEESGWLRAFWKPRLLFFGAGIGATVIVLGFPTALVGHVDPVIERVFGKTDRTSNAIGPTAPLWWWFLRTYASAFGWPLLFGAVGGLVASLAHLADLAPGRASVRQRVPGFDERALLVGALLLFLLFFAPWHDFRVHHLLPTFPLAMVLLADSLRRLTDHRRRIGRVVMAAVVVTAAIYAGVGVAMYASMPRDEATEWLADNADEDATMETYYHGFLENAVPHGMGLNPVWDGDATVEPCPEYIQVGYKDLLYLQDIPDDQRGADVDDRVDERATYIRALVDGEYSYELVAEFGDRPSDFVPERPTPGSARDLLPLGIYPHSDQYGDEQELRANQYVAIYHNTGPCDPSRSPPW
jgi:hypothetical protein